MKGEESRAEEYLRSLQLGEVIFEPRGNVAPDFEVGGNIAVEVRRLNQNYVRGGRIRSLEEDQIPLLAKVRNVVHHFSPLNDTTDDHSWFLHYVIKHRPLDPWQVLKPRLMEFLDFFYCSDRSLTQWQLTANFAVTLIPASSRLASFYRLGGYSDHDAGGWLVSELIRNIKLCIEDKAKVLESLHTYSERWLLLIDHIGYGGKEEFSIARQGWDKIILLAPHGRLAAYEPDV